MTSGTWRAAEGYVGCFKGSGVVKSIDSVWYTKGNN